MRAAFPLLQTLQRCETVTDYREPAARTVVAPRPIAADSRRPGRAKTLPKAVHVPGHLSTKPEHPPAASQLFALPQVSARPSATPLPADCYSTTPATARGQLPALLPRLARWLRRFRWKCPHVRIVRAGPPGTSILYVVCGSCALQ